MNRMQKYNFYTAKELKPSGWLKRQLTLEALGLVGNLDKVWPDVRDSAWIGGSREGWERVPYWLDGFIPLAYLLEDADMIARAKRYMDAILSAQQSDGWICPCKPEERPTYDTWAVLLISKVLTVYYDCSGDERIPDVLYRVMKNYYELLENGTIQLFSWGKWRWFEGFIALNFLYERYREDWIRKLAKILKTQGADYEEASAAWETPLNQWTFGTHVVNLGMMMKYEAVSCDLLGDDYQGLGDRLYQKLIDRNGTPSGSFTGDECLSGLSPIQGTELCAIVEMMYSCELLYAQTGDAKWAELLERVAFNNLPATVSDDQWTHQYDQLSNQIACIAFPGKPVFRTNGQEAHLFGLEPNYGCCTANMGQGWPKFALSAFLHGENVIENVLPVPSVLDCAAARIVLETDYPFRNTLHYTIEARNDFTFRVRIPSWAKNLTVNGCTSSETAVSFAFSAGEQREVEISFTAVPELFDRPHDLKSVRYGSFIFSLPIQFERKMREYVRDGVERKFPYCDYELIPQSDWNYAYCNTDLQVEEHPVDAVPFSSEHPALTIRAHARKIPWGYADGYNTVCAKVPESREPVSEAETVTLCPYGCAKLRMTELPLLD